MHEILYFRVNYMSEFEKYELQGAQIMHELDSYNHLSVNECSKVLGVEPDAVNCMLRGGVINNWIIQGLGERNSRDEVAHRKEIAVSNLLRLAYAVKLKRESGGDITKWKGTASEYQLNHVTLSCNIRLELLESRYWKGVERRALSLGIVLSQYPTMNIEYCRYLCDK